VVFPSIGTSLDPAPEAHFAWNSDAETEVLNVDATASTGTIDTYSWDFGDGIGTDTGVTTLYNYGGTPPNNYTVTLTVTGPGGSDQASTEITTGDQIGGSV
jgi:PKD repeat protein